MRETLLVFMGLEALPAVAVGPLAHGVESATPAAVVSRGTLPGEQTVAAPLARIADDAAGLATPALLVVGEVVAIAGRFAAAEPELVRSHG